MKFKLRMKLIQVVFAMFTVFYLLIISRAAYAEPSDKTLKMEIGKQRKINLSEAPLAIEITDPNIIDLERVGVSNSILITPKKNGLTQIICQYNGKKEIKYNVIVESKLTIQKDKPILNLSQITGMRYAKELTNIPGLETLVEDNKITILGKISKIEDFIQVVSIITGRENLFQPAFSFAPELLPSIIKFVQQDLKFFNEPNLTLSESKGRIILQGLVSTPENKERVFKHLKEYLPGIIDATNLSFLTTDLVQINLNFLEVGNNAHLNFGLKWSQNGNELDTQNLYKSTVKDASNIQIIPYSIAVQAFQDKNFARELANPVLLTRADEQAEFHAGGEVPLVTEYKSTNKGTEETIEFKPFGIQLQVTPKLLTSNTIMLKIHAEVSSIDEAISYRNVPGFQSRKITTSLILEEGKCAILSGLVRAKNSKGLEKIPFLGSIPILGELFKSRKFQDEESELWLGVSALVNSNSLNNKTNFQQQFKNAEGKINFSILD